MHLYPIHPLQCRIPIERGGYELKNMFYCPTEFDYYKLHVFKYIPCFVDAIVARSVFKHNQFCEAMIRDLKVTRHNLNMNLTSYVIKRVCDLEQDSRNLIIAGRYNILHNVFLKEKKKAEEDIEDGWKKKVSQTAATDEWDRDAHDVYDQFIGVLEYRNLSAGDVFIKCQGLMDMDSYNYSRLNITMFKKLSQRKVLTTKKKTSSGSRTAKFDDYCNLISWMQRTIKNHINNKTEQMHPNSFVDMHFD